MLRVSISQIVPGESGDHPHLLARFRVDAEGIHHEDGERTDVVATIPVIDPDTGQRLESGEDPLRWAQLLPGAIRSGDLSVLVQEIVEPQGAGAGQDPIEGLATEISEGPVAGVEYVH